MNRLDRSDSDLSATSIRRELGELLPRRGTSDQAEMGIGSDDLEPGRRYLRALSAGGWVVPQWPTDLGGRSASVGTAELIASVRGEFEAPDLYPFLIGLYMVGPTLLEVGSPEQKHRWLRSIADGSEVWCQMFSEPDAGSDLANVALRAERDGSTWRLSGQKVWVSRASWADWGFALARTAPDAPKHAGLTAFVIDMHAPGVTVRPLRQINHDRHFSEVFLDDVAVPDTSRVGDVNAGWGVAISLLARERTVGGKPRTPRWDSIPEWLRAAARHGLLDDATRRDHAMRVVMMGAVAALADVVDTGAAGASGSVSKLRNSAHFKAEADLRAALAGAAAMLADHDGYLHFMTAPAMSIRGGTDEIQRNIVGERVLGLPPEPRVDRTAPWSETRHASRP